MTLKQKLLAAFTPRHLGLAVSPTEQCNFRCTYCYESFEVGRMSDGTFRALQLFVDKRMPGLTLFSLNWFGGEPLLQRQRMVAFTRYCRERAQQHDVAMPPASVPTNGWFLTRGVLDELVDAGIGRFMVSLDGERDQHDLTRRRISGRGSFDRIYRNLLDARGSDRSFLILLRLHLTRDNIQSQLRLADRLAADFGNDQRFDVLPRAVGDFGGAGIDKVSLLKSTDRRVEEEVVQRFGRIAAFDAQIDQYVCYAAKPNHIVVRPDGRLVKCTTALDREDNIVGRLLPDGEIELDEAKVLAWSFGFQTGNPQHLACPYFGKPT